jgi:hypothetical protein
MMRLLLFGLLLPSFLCAQNTANIDQIQDWLDRGSVYYAEHPSLPQLIGYLAQLQEGVPYQSGLLDANAEEKLVVTVEGYDCVIFVEMCLAMALSIANNNGSYEEFEYNLRRLRYREGVIDGYCSRNHYFTDWILENEKAGLLDVLGQDYEGSKPLQKLSFMSKNSHLYPNLHGNTANLDDILERESVVNARGLRFIPSARVLEFENVLKTGDIISFVSKIEGLDVSHTGIVIKDGESIRFRHASTKGSVMLEHRSISEYLRANTSMIGILCARPKVKGARSQ